MTVVSPPYVPRWAPAMAACCQLAHITRSGNRRAMPSSNEAHALDRSLHGGAHRLLLSTMSNSCYRHTALVYSSVLCVCPAISPPSSQSNKKEEQAKEKEARATKKHKGQRAATEVRQGEQSGRPIITLFFCD
jgi:hypothetical protein